MKKTITLIIVFFSALLLGQAKSPATESEIPKLGVSGTVSPGSIISPLEELSKKREEVRKLAEETLKRTGYVPMEGAIDPETFILGPHDIIRCQVWGPSPQDIVTEVSPDGYVVVPGYGSIFVAGKKWSEAKDSIEVGIKNSFGNVPFAITLAEIRTFLAHVTGAVKMPGSYQATSAQRVADIIDLAGGASLSADMSKVQIRHKNNAVDTIDLYKYRSLGIMSQNPLLLDGDIIFVPQTEITDKKITIYGASIRNGDYPYKPSETIRQLMSRVGLYGAAVQMEQIQIVRGTEHFTIDILQNDFEVKENDIIIFNTQFDSVIVGGMAAHAGAFPYHPQMTVEGYIALAGGPEKDASERTIAVYRNGKKISICKGSPLKPGDVVIVKPSSFYVFRDIIDALYKVTSAVVTTYFLFERLKQ